MDLNQYSTDDIYYAGFEDGKSLGYNEGWTDASNEYENRLAKYWAELHTLNARIDYLEKLTGGTNEG